MKLYEIMIEHFARKGSEKGIYTYLVAESNEDVYEWLKLEKELKDGRQLFLPYSIEENESEDFIIYDDKYNELGVEKYKERIIRLQGDLNDEELDLDDLDYGRTVAGWKEVKSNITLEEISLLENLGISIEKHGN